MGNTYDQIKYGAENLRHKASKAFHDRRDKKHKNGSRDILIMMGASMALAGFGSYELLDERVPDIDHQGTVQQQSVLEDVTTQLGSVEALSAEYDALRGKQAEIANISDPSLLADPDIADKTATDIALAEHRLEQGLEKLFATMYTEGSAADGMALAETDVRDLMADISELDIDFQSLSANYDFGKMASPNQAYAYLDEARADIQLGKDASVSERFSAAQDMMQDAQYASSSHGATNRLFAMLLGMVLGCVPLLWATGKRVEGWAKNKPQKPHTPKH